MRSVLIPLALQYDEQFSRRRTGHDIGQIEKVRIKIAAIEVNSRRRTCTCARPGRLPRRISLCRLEVIAGLVLPGANVIVAVFGNAGVRFEPKFTSNASNVVEIE